MGERLKNLQATIVAAAALHAIMASRQSRAKFKPGQTWDVLDLPLRARNALSKEGITTIAELAAMTKPHLACIRGMGSRTVRQVAARLGEHGIQLGEGVDANNAMDVAADCALARQYADTLLAGMKGAEQ
jgi:DNA-directed RNA polymerase alpha subunit